MKTYHIYYSYRELPDTWAIMVSHDIFLQSLYLKALEEATPKNIQLFYVGVFDAQELVGVAVVQRVQLYLKDMFRANKVSYLKEFLRNMISKVLKGNLLVVGNLTHTGQHGMYFKEDKISQKAYLEQVFKALDKLCHDIKKDQNKNIRAIMFKDFFLEDSIHNEKALFEDQDLQRVSVQPNMIMTIPPNWITFDDYVKSFNKKYRDRYKRARNKLGKIKSSELDLEVIKAQSNQLYELYLNVSNNAQFNTFLLPENHFVCLKQQLDDNFRVFGYYLNNQLVGFYTLIINNKSLETYFLGYDKEHQYPNQLYLNMLYDMAQFTIENSMHEVVYARTAMEIKSSVGAEPKSMVVYIMHTNGFLNAILKRLFALMDPTQKWQERHPFEK